MQCFRKQIPTHLIVKPGSRLANRISKKLTGATKIATEVAKHIQNGKIIVHYMNRQGFKEAVKKEFPWGDRSCVKAWALGVHIFVCKSRRRVYENIVHEGGHALSNIYGTKGENNDYDVTWGGLKIGVYREERKVRRAEREFMKTEGKICWCRYLTDNIDLLSYLL